MVSAQRASDLITGLLDSGYEQATRQVLDAIAASLRSGRVGRRLDELDAEALRLALAGERLTPDNPVVVALLNDLEPALTRAAARTDVGAVAAQEAGADAAGVIQRGLALGDVDVGVLARLGINWNVPDPEAIAALTDYTSMPAWEEQIGALPLDVLDTVRNQIVRGVVQGWGPERVARAVRRVATGLAPHKANNLMRTVQLESYRTATAAHQRANADIAQRQIRIEVLDQRTCLACIALHGSEMPVGAKVEDHHQGRGTSILEVRGRPLNIQTGPEWFDSLSDEQKEGLAAFRRSPGKLEALRSGRATLADFVQPYEDPVFGQMVREGSIDFAQRGGGPGVPGPVRGPSGGGDRPPGQSGQGRVWSQSGLIEDDPAGVSDIADVDALTEYMFSDGPRAKIMWDMNARMNTGGLSPEILPVVDGFTDEGQVNVDGERLYQHIKDYVRSTRHQEMSRGYFVRDIQRAVREEGGGDISEAEAEAVFNRTEAQRADAMFILARVAGVRLTDPQTQRLTRARNGDFLNMQFEEVGDAGSVINAIERARDAKGATNSAERARLRADWQRTMGDNQGINTTADEMQRRASDFSRRLRRRLGDGGN